MKKFLTILIVVLSTSMILASQKMQLELINYWKTNEIEYFEDDNLIYLPLTENENISVAMWKRFDLIYFIFEIDIKIEDYTEFFLNTEKLPYSEQFRKDLLNCFMENLTYYTTFNRALDPYHEWIGNYLVRVNFSVMKNWALAFLGIN